jgi:hypothetical protein
MPDNGIPGGQNGTAAGFISEFLRFSSANHYSTIASYLYITST